MADVNVGMHNIVALGLKGQACPILVYKQHLNGCLKPYRIQHSKNYQGVAVSQDALNNVNGKPKVLTLAQLFDFSSWFFDQQLTTPKGFMCDSEMDALVYIGHHLRFWRVIRALAMKKGRQDVVAKANLMILVLLVHSAVTAMPRPVKGFSAVEEKPRPGAGHFTANAGLSNFENKFPLLVGLVGQRSFGREARFDQGYWSGPLCEALGMMPAGEDTLALRRAGYDASWGLTARQEAVLKLVVSRDKAALQEAIGWIATVKTHIESVTEWRTGGMQIWLPSAPGGSTAPVNYRGVEAGSGVQHILCACNGQRNSSAGDTDVGPSTTTVSGSSAFTKRDDLPAVDAGGVHHTASCPSIGGNLIAKISWGPNGHRVA